MTETKGDRCDECGFRGEHAIDCAANQCDGCLRGLPLTGGVHKGPGYDLIACTAHLYTTAAPPPAGGPDFGAANAFAAEVVDGAAMFGVLPSAALNLARAYLALRAPVPASGSEEPFNTLAVEVNAINRANGWNVLTPERWEDPYHVPAVLALIGSEVSEALEGFRHNDRENFAEELADVVIRVLDCAGGLGINLDATIRAKVEKNKARGHKHGGKRV